MRLDSIGKFKIPSQEDVRSDLQKLQTELNNIEGVSNAKCVSDFEHYIFTIKGNFKNVLALNKAYTAIYNFKRKDKITYIEAYVFEKEFFQRKEIDPKTNIFDKNPFLSEADFNAGKVMIVARFKKPVKSVSNETTLISKNGLAVLTKCTTAQFIKKPSRINCKVNF